MWTGRKALRSIQIRQGRRNQWRHGIKTEPEQRALVAPANFSLINNPEESVAYVAQVRQRRLTKTTRVDLSRVMDVTVDALLVLVADTPDAQYCELRGNLPRNPRARRLVTCSGFHALVHGIAPPAQPIGALFHDQSGVKVLTKAASRAAAFIAGFLGQTRHKPSRSILIECMGNTHNHAEEQRGSRPWQLWAWRDEGKQRVCCAFVDFGRGICRTVKSNWARQLGIVQDGELLAAALQGVTSNGFTDFFGRVSGETPAGIADHSSTGLANRGYGLPHMLENVSDGGVQRLVLVSNRGYVEVTAPGAVVTHRTLSTEFEGTVVCWEVDARSEGSLR